MLGFMTKVSKEEIYGMPLEELCAQVQILWAGDIACEILLGKRWTGGRGDFDAVDNLMKMLAGHGYFADRLPLNPNEPFADRVIAEAANRYADRVKTNTRALVVKHKTLVETMRDGLLEKGELDSKEISGMLEGYGI